MYLQFVWIVYCKFKISTNLFWINNIFVQLFTFNSKKLSEACIVFEILLWTIVDTTVKHNGFGIVNEICGLFKSFSVS